jgi:hypothetical protein
VKLVHFAILAALFACGVATAQVIDQDNSVPIVTELDIQRTTARWQQEVQVGITGELAGIELFAGEDPGSFIVSVNRGMAWQTDESEFSVVVAPDRNAPLYIDLSAQGLWFIAGEYFVIGLTGTGSTEPRFGMQATDSMSYGPGRLFIDVVDPLEYHFDLAFRTYVVPVPEPSSHVLLAVGLVLVIQAKRLVRGRLKASAGAAKGA